MVGGRVFGMSCKSDFFGVFFVYFLVIEEGGVKMKLIVIDISGFGD